MYEHCLVGARPQLDYLQARDNDDIKDTVDSPPNIDKIHHSVESTLY